MGRLDGKQYIIKTIITTGLISLIGSIQVKCFECLTGFKYIAEIIREHEAMQYIGRRGEFRLLGRRFRP
ncbi:MAG: hypothetical protein ACLR8Y_18850 [Alistipes indistinctus]